MNQDIARMSYESALAALEQTVDQLGREQEDLAECVRMYERGLALARRCTDLLRDAERRLNRTAPAPDPSS